MLSVLMRLRAPETPRRSVPATATHTPEGPVVQETAPAAAVTTSPVTTGYAPPLCDGSIDAGICYVVFRAALTRCRFVNEDGD